MTYVYSLVILCLNCTIRKSNQQRSGYLSPSKQYIVIMHFDLQLCGYYMWSEPFDLACSQRIVGNYRPIGILIVM